MTPGEEHWLRINQALNEVEWLIEEANKNHHFDLMRLEGMRAELITYLNELSDVD